MYAAEISGGHVTPMQFTAQGGQQLLDFQVFGFSDQFLQQAGHDIGITLCCKQAGQFLDGLAQLFGFLARAFELAQQLQPGPQLLRSLADIVHALFIKRGFEIQCAKRLVVGIHVIGTVCYRDLTICSIHSASMNTMPTQ